MDFSDKEFEFQWFIKEAKKDGIELETEDQYRQLQRDMNGMAGDEGFEPRHLQ